MKSNANNSPAPILGTPIPSPSKPYCNSPADNMSTLEEWEEWGSERMFRGMHDEVVLLSHQGGVKVLKCDNEAILKVGSRVRPSEEIAMRLVKEQTDIPVPEIFLAAYVGEEGRLAMSVIPGAPLTEAWDSLHDTTKKRICIETWSMIEKFRQIEKPAALQHHFLCLADGSPCINDPIVAGICCADPPHPPLLNNDDVRARIYECYYAANGRKYEKELLSMLPHSDISVFSHVDIGPHNIMFDKASLKITGIIDWEMAGWYPDYWEYSSIMRPARWKDWQKWMDLTAPKKYDLSGIMAARRVLF
ncbi:conserved hypothetical protein [Histoplasma capsulatum var. duboisii H88]|uniref:Aminoglycoside phosphotransferase domain-containing protein n=3 Tax=Ajellomyces capsulatus TaxID=5037 RepID=F0U6K5_AJEC8|nr:conserved hypothetical protein [Histoplasma capsulatum H143]EGC40644.1 conserved hypothetical protein [Histoplasma capsulatum var. duboisii H88]